MLDAHVIPRRPTAISLRLLVQISQKIPNGIAVLAAVPLQYCVQISHRNKSILFVIKQLKENSENLQVLVLSDRRRRYVRVLDNVIITVVAVTIHLLHLPLVQGLIIVIMLRHLAMPQLPSQLNFTIVVLVQV